MGWNKQENSPGTPLPAHFPVLLGLTRSCAYPPLPLFLRSLIRSRRGSELDKHSICQWRLCFAGVLPSANVIQYLLTTAHVGPNSHLIRQRLHCRDICAIIFPEFKPHKHSYLANTVFCYNHGSFSSSSKTLTNHSQAFSTSQLLAAAMPDTQSYFHVSLNKCSCAPQKASVWAKLHPLKLS